MTTVDDLLDSDDYRPLPTYEDGTVKVFCSFCGQDNRSVSKMIQGPSAAICNECVMICIEEMMK